MFKLLYKIIFIGVLFVSINAFGSTPTERIIGGGRVFNKNFTWMAPIYRSPGASNEKYFLCGGVLIQKDLVATAAHCVVRDNGEIVPVEELKVVANSLFLNGYGEKFLPVNKVTVHEKYNPVLYHNDIALLKLGGKFDKSPIPVATKEIMKYIETRDKSGLFSILGFGSTIDRNNNLSSYLKKANVSYVSRGDCDKYWNNITGTQICAGDVGRDTCSGDSGGPLFVNAKGNRYLVGITSYGPEKGCGTGIPAVYTKIYNYREWIEDNSLNSVSLDVNFLGVEESVGGKNLKFVIKNNSINNTAYKYNLRLDNIKYIKVNNNNCYDFNNSYIMCNFYKSIPPGGHEYVYINVSPMVDNIKLSIKMLYSIENNNFSFIEKPLSVNLNKNISTVLETVQQSVEESNNSFKTVINFSLSQVGNLVSFVAEDLLGVDVLSLNENNCDQNVNIKCIIKDSGSYDVNFKSDKDKFISNLIIEKNGNIFQIESLYVNLVEEPLPKEKVNKDKNTSSGGGSVGILMFVVACILFRRNNNT